MAVQHHSPAVCACVCSCSGFAVSRDDKTTLSRFHSQMSSFSRQTVSMRQTLLLHAFIYTYIFDMEYYTCSLLAILAVTIVMTRAPSPLFLLSPFFFPPVHIYPTSFPLSFLSLSPLTAPKAILLFCHCLCPVPSPFLPC